MTYDLSLIPLEELFKELDRRFDHFVFAGLKVSLVPNGDPRQVARQDLFRHHAGNSPTCLGLCSILERHIHNKLEEIQEEGQP